MKIYLDSAQEKSWTLPAGCPPVCGVTTNPTLVYQAGLAVTLLTYQRLLRAAADYGMKEIMLQLPSPDPLQARQWHGVLKVLAHDLNVVMTIKMPCHPDWIPAIEAMQHVQQAVLLTGLSNPVQLLWAQYLRADYVAPYLGRLAADGRDMWALVEACIATQADGPALLAASVKSADVLAKLIALGAAAVTLPPASLIAWADDSLTVSAIAQFERDSADSLRLTA